LPLRRILALTVNLSPSGSDQRAGSGLPLRPMEVQMTLFETIPTAKDFPLAALIVAKRKSERVSAHAAAARFAREIAARHAKDSRDYAGAIDSPMFANV